MISKQEIMLHATNNSLAANIIEKDYIISWLLAGIANTNELSKCWVFKGGTCLKKCYFEHYRFSEDLDFTVNNASQLNHDFLIEQFIQIADWIYDNSGIEIPSDRINLFS